MKYISIGDVVGENGIKILKKHLPILIEKHNIDFVIVNIENMAEGLGIDIKTFNEVANINDIDCFVLGNQRQLKLFLIKEL